MKNENSTKIWILVLSLLGITFIMGGSYAYFAVSVTSEPQIVMLDTLEITYETGQDILVENALPQSQESIESSPGHQFTIRNTGDRDITYNMFLARYP